MAFSQRAWLAPGLLLGVTSGCGLVARTDQAPGGRAGEAGVVEAGETRDDADGEDPQAPDVHDLMQGVVVDFVTGRPLAGRSVSISGLATVTDQDGRFGFPKAPPLYDATVTEPDRSTITLFKGLHRMDPVLPHVRSSGADRTSKTGTIRGILSGGMPYPLGPKDTGGVYFFSQAAEAHELLGGQQPAPFDGPAYGPMRGLWNGPDAIDGQLFAIAVFPDGAAVGGDAGDAGPGYSAWFASRALTLSNGQDAVVDLALASTPFVRVAGTVNGPQGYAVTQLQEYYRLPIPGAVIPLTNAGTMSSTFDSVVPDLTAFGLTMCVAAFSVPPTSSEPSNLWTQRCGTPAGTTGVSILLRQPPSLSMVAGDGDATLRTQFGWTGADAGGIYELALQSSPPSSATSLHVFLSTTSLDGSDLVSTGFAFAPTATYRVVVGSLGPYATMDDACGAGGLAASISAEAWKSYSQGVDLSTQ